MPKKLSIILSTLACSGALFAEPAVGKLSATDGVTVSGAAISFRGIPSWPIVAGDEIRTTSSAATLTLSDGSLFRIAAGSLARVETSGGRQIIRVTEGSLHVSNIAAGTSVASRKGIVPADRGVLKAESSSVAAEPAAVQSGIARYDLPAPSRRR